MKTSSAYRWQTTGHQILGDLIAAGSAQGLPPLMWTLAQTGALTGEADTLSPDADPRAAITAWANYLGVTVTKTPRSDGRISLTAPLTHAGERHGILRAELYPDE